MSFIIRIYQICQATLSFTGMTDVFGQKSRQTKSQTEKEKLICRKIQGKKLKQYAFQHSSQGRINTVTILSNLISSFLVTSISVWKPFVWCFSVSLASTMSNVSASAEYRISLFFCNHNGKLSLDPNSAKTYPWK